MRKENNNRIRKAAPLLLMAVMALSACSKGGSADAKAPAKAGADTAITGAEFTEAAPAAQTEESGEAVTILIAAAASLKYSYEDELIPMFEAQNPGIKVQATFDSSGKLKTQLEEGLEADVFMSAAVKQMTELTEENLIDAGSVIDLLENKIVLIVPEGVDAKVSGFTDITDADVIAIGDPESVPAGQYAKEALTSLGLWDEVEAKSTKGTNVTEVLNWVAEGSADAGIVYATDAKTTKNVLVIAEAPAGSLAQKVIYPVGIVSTSANREAAQQFVDFLQTGEALAVFEQYGFSANQ